MLNVYWLNMPQYLQDKELQSSIQAATAQAVKSFSDFLQAWENGPELLAEMGNPSPEDFVWAMAMVRCVCLAFKLQL